MAAARGTAGRKGSQMNQLFRRIVVDDSGQDLVEYTLLLVLLALAAVAAMQFLGVGVNGVFQDAHQELQSAQ